MKIIRKVEAITSRPATTAMVTDYMDNGEVISSVISVNGRYPRQGFSRDEAKSRAFYVMRGSGRISTQVENEGLNPGDTVILEPDEAFYFKGRFSIYSIRMTPEPVA
jgi:mannose-6-phosphate isomerase-like protein (cupin superfamily)